MASRVVMPKLTDTMEEGVLLAWKKHEGDRVQAGEVIAEIETDKAVMDLEAFAPGVLRKVLVQDGDTVQSGKLIAVIAEADEDIASALSDGVTAAPSISNGAKTDAAPKKASAPAQPARSDGLGFGRYAGGGIVGQPEATRGGGAVVVLGFQAPAKGGSNVAAHMICH